MKRFRSQPFFASFHDTFEDVFGRVGSGITIELGSWEVFSAFSKKGLCVIFQGKKLCDLDRKLLCKIKLFINLIK